jgi:hypothetical protein
MTTVPWGATKGARSRVIALVDRQHPGSLEEFGAERG